MISYLLNFTKRADKDENDIYNYIAVELGEIYAKRFRANFIEFCNPFPAMFSLNSQLCAAKGHCCLRSTKARLIP